MTTDKQAPQHKALCDPQQCVAADVEWQKLRSSPQRPPLVQTPGEGTASGFSEKTLAWGGSPHLKMRGRMASAPIRKLFPVLAHQKKIAILSKKGFSPTPDPSTNLLQECEWFLKAVFFQIRGQKTAQRDLQVQPVEKHAQQNNCYKFYGLIISKHHKRFYVGFTHLY